MLLICSKSNGRGSCLLNIPSECPCPHKKPHEHKDNWRDCTEHQCQLAADYCDLNGIVCIEYNENDFNIGLKIFKDAKWSLSE